MNARPRILKFGGTSVADGARLNRVAEIVRLRADSGPVAVVVSALGGVTNQLETAIRLAAAHEDGFETIVDTLVERHLQAARLVAEADALEELRKIIDERLAQLREMLRGAHMLREASPRARDSILSTGERLSSRLLVAALRSRGVPAERVAAQSILTTDATFGDARVDLAASRDAIRAAIEPLAVAVVPGFLGASPEGDLTTLGRGGSDYTAALLGAALEAPEIELWTDVDAVMSADPRRVPGAFPLSALTYGELHELAHFGAGVVYPPTVSPARRAGIPLSIRNTFNPDAPGTRVTERAEPSRALIRGVASIPQVCLLGLVGDRLDEVTSAASRLVGALDRAGVRALLISQSSVEGSITVGLLPDDVEPARRIADEEFALERRLGWVAGSSVAEGLSIVTVVGEDMRERVGLSARLFGVLGRRGINIRVIAQSASERSITVVIADEDHDEALRAVHDSFFSSEPEPLEVVLAGVGQVGGALLAQLAERVGAGDASVRLVGLVDSRGAVFAPEGLDPSAGKPGPEVERIPIEELLSAWCARAGRDRTFIDATASGALGQLYPRLLASGTSVVAANKRPFTTAFSEYRELAEAAAKGGSHLFHEATVGAGLPVLSTIADLRRTGDEVTAVDGVLSGTLNFVLDQVDSGASLSQAVREAFEKGLTEPHPAEDLTGADVARKLCILARAAGEPLEMAAVACEPLVSERLLELPVDELWEELARLDEEFERRRAEATARGERLRYVARLSREEGTVAEVGLRSVPAEHPCFSVRGADNLVAITSRRYGETPLAIRGPGAGPAVTAAGVFADLLRTARESGRGTA